VLRKFEKGNIAARGVTINKEFLPKELPLKPGF
jgi:hypothetical protein